MGHPKNRVTIKKDRDWGEYIVRTFRGGKLVGTYHTDDKKDAQDTAAYIRRDEHSKGFMNPKRRRSKRRKKSYTYRHRGKKYTLAQLRRKLGRKNVTCYKVCRKKYKPRPRSKGPSKVPWRSGSTSGWYEAALRSMPSETRNPCHKRRKRNGSHYKFGRKYAKRIVGRKRWAEKLIRRGKKAKRRRRRAASYRASRLIGPTDRKYFAKHGRFRSARRKMLYRKLTQMLNSGKRSRRKSRNSGYASSGISFLRGARDRMKRLIARKKSGEVAGSFKRDKKLLREIQQEIRRRR
jgi:hypothetical protein